MRAPGSQAFEMAAIVRQVVYALASARERVLPESNNTLAEGRSRQPIRRNRVIHTRGFRTRRPMISLPNKAVLPVARPAGRACLPAHQNSRRAL